MLKSKARIKKTWNCIAKKYGGYRRELWNPVRDFLEKVDDDLLDIGSGDCPITKSVLKKGVDLYAVDFSKEMLKRVPKEVNAVLADATKIPLKRKFKYITAIAVLHHMPKEEDRVGMLNEINRLLSKNGEALITVLRKEKKGDFLLKWGEFKRYYHIFSKKELEDLLNNQGFEDYRISKIKNNWIIKIRKKGR